MTDKHRKEILDAVKMRGGRSTAIIKDKSKYSRKKKHKGRKEW